MRKNKLTSGNLILCIISAVILMTGVCLSIANYKKYNQDFIYNKARVLVSTDVDKIEKCSSNYPSLKYPYMVSDLKGKVLYASPNINYDQDDVVNVNELLQFDKSYYDKNNDMEKVAFALKDKNKEVYAFAVFNIAKADILEMTEAKKISIIFMPSIVCAAVVIIMIFIRSVYLYYRISRPVNDINKSSKAIIEGNYSVPVVKTRSSKVMANELDELSYNFELMRDELIDRQNREEELKKQQKELISCISHDLKTPVSTIKACSEALRDGIASSEEKRTKYAETIVKKADVLTNMMNDLLDYSNAELNELVMVKEDCYFDEWFRNIAKELKIFASHESVELEVDSSIPNLLINMDEKRISEVLYNLVDNAVKYMDKPEKKIIIRGCLDEDKKHVFISVKDNGRGISMTDIPYVFDKFYRAEKSRTMRIPGSGLGLAICKYIIEEHGGTINCSSKLDEGTEFQFSLKF